jgi:hypothetical protein
MKETIMYGFSVQGFMAKALMVAVLLSLPAQSLATPFSLWIGNDTATQYPVLNTDTAGNLLRTGGNVNVTGFAIDSANNTIYYGAGDYTGSLITPRDLTTLAPGTGFNTPPAINWGEDMTFDGSSIWRAGFNGVVAEINPTSGALTSSFNPFGRGAMGIAWDGSFLWVSQFSGGTVAQFTTAGVATGLSFDNGLSNGGGLAWDPRDSTLWVGGRGAVYHFDTTGTNLGSFSVGDDRFVDGLEMELGESAPIPEPSAMLVFGIGLMVVGASARRRG